MDPFALPCHPTKRVSAQDRDWRAIGMKSADAVTRKSTRCPECKTSWTAYLRDFAAPEPAAGPDDGPAAAPVGSSALVTVEWVRPTPFRVHAVAPDTDRPDVPLWQDGVSSPSSSASSSPDGQAVDTLAELQERAARLGPTWERSVQGVRPVQTLTAQGLVFAEPGDLLLERRERWNAQDRRLALIFSPRLDRPVVAWHGFARLLQD